MSQQHKSSTGQTQATEVREPGEGRRAIAAPPAPTVAKQWPLART